MGGVLVVVLLVAAGVWWWRQRGAHTAAQVEVLSREADRMEQVAAEMTGLQTRLTAAMKLGNHAEAIRVCERMLQLVDADLDGNHEYALPLLQGLADLQEAADHPQGAVAPLRRLAALQEKAGTEPAEVCATLARLAALQLDGGTPEEAQAALKRELELRRRHGMLRSPAALPVLRGLIETSILGGHVAAAEGFRREYLALAPAVGADRLHTRLDEAQSDFMRALDAGRLRQAWRHGEETALLATALHGAEHAIALVCRANLAEVLRRNRHFEAADRLFRELIPLQQRLHPEPDALSSLYGNMALLCDDTGHPDEAAQWRQQQKQLLSGADVPLASRVNALNNEAVSLSGQRCDEAAVYTYEKALALAPDGAGLEPAFWADMMHGYGIALYNVGRLRDAGRAHQQVIARKKAGVDIPLPQLASSLNGLGFVYEGLGRLREAREMYTRALNFKERFLTDGPSLETAWHNLGSVCARLGDFVVAREMAQRLVTARELRLGDTHPDTVTARQNLAAVQRQMAGAPTAFLATREAAERALLGAVTGSLRRYSTYDFGRARDELASSVLVPDDDFYPHWLRAKKVLPAGWQAFIGTSRWLGEEVHEGKAELVLCTGTSQFDCLRTARIEPVNHGLSTEDVVRVMEDYHHRFGVRICRAETDTLGFLLLKQPEDVDAFVDELIDFCMDLEDMGRDVVREAVTSPARYISLWWD